MNGAPAGAVAEALAAIDRWPGVAAAGVAGSPARATSAAGVAGSPGPLPTGVIAVAGPTSRAFPWASVTKILTALAVWVAVEEGTLAWGDAAGPPGCTVAHLLSHASGLAPDDDRVLAPPATRRIYSNRGIEVAAAALEDAAGMTFAEYLAAGVLEPLGMTGTVLDGSPASGAVGPLEDLLALGRELLAPALIDAGTVAQATRVAFSGLAGVLPGFGQQVPNDWGLGVELRSHKSPHWTGSLNSPATFGHFGRSGSFLWVDPIRSLAVAALSGTPFGPWAVDAWPALSDAVIAACGHRP
ncbi:MAG: serine hydrolase domain-containing protein [Acidimicrobiales bacterium]